MPIEIIKDKTTSVAVVQVEDQKSQQPDYFKILKAKFVQYAAGLGNGKPLENEL